LLMPKSATKTVFVIGINDDEEIKELSDELKSNLRESELIVASKRYFRTLGKYLPSAKLMAYPANFYDGIASLINKYNTLSFIASGDPGFFGILSFLNTKVSHQNIKVYPALSSVALAFSSIGLAWDDAKIITLHGREPFNFLRNVRCSNKIAILCSPKNPPEKIAAFLLKSGEEFYLSGVGSNISKGKRDINILNLKDISKRSWDPNSILVLVRNDPLTMHLPMSKTYSAHSYVKNWAINENEFLHDKGMITKAEVRSFVLSKLNLSDSAVLWDIGSASGSVAIEASLLFPGLRVYAIEKNPKRAENLAKNADKFDVSIEIIVDDFFNVIDCLPKPNCVFIGGGKIKALEYVLKYTSASAIVANYSSFERAAFAYKLLGNCSHFMISRFFRKEASIQLQKLTSVYVAYKEP
jgi:precorrin-6Y C5,15-methyltransferase (decarboxylating)